MATQSKVTPTGWSQYDDSATFSRVTPSGWNQFEAAGGPTSWTITPSGGVTISGASPYVLGKVLSPAGGVALGGTSLQVHGKIIPIAGGITLGGTAPVYFPTRIYTPSGGVVLGGHAAVVFSGISTTTSKVNFSLGRHTMRNDVWTGLH